MTTERLPEYRVKARNTGESSENRIHDDAVARRYGFRGALVPGVTVYAYMTRPLVEAFGAAWLARGTATVRFVNLALYPAAPLPAERPAATRAHLDALAALGTPVNTYDEARAAGYLEKVGDGFALYRGTAGWVHPGFFLDQANRALDRNVRMGPWIHVGSTVRHLGGARVGETLATRGRVRSLFEKKGREFVELDLVVVAGARARPVAHVLHTAIYRLPAV